MNIALIDTSSYLLLGRCLHPALGRTFGPLPWTSQAIAELDREYGDKSSLAQSHHWFIEPQYSDNRAGNVFDWKAVSLMGVRQWKDNILQYCRANSKVFREAGCSIPSPADCLLAAYAAALVEGGERAAVVTDDKGLHLAVTLLETSDVMHGYEMLAHFVQAGHITNAAAKALYEELAYMRSLPGSWRRGCHAAFGFASP